jgi:hypothetical protein
MLNYLLQETIQWQKDLGGDRDDILSSIFEILMGVLSLEEL